MGAGRVRLRLVAACVAVWSVVPMSASALVTPAVPKIEIGPPASGMWDPLDPPSFAPLDLTAPPNAGAAHPRLLFSSDELPALRARVADPATVPGRAFRTLLGYVDRLDVGEPVVAREFGRQDLADTALAWLITQDVSYLDKARQLLVTVAAAAPNYGAAEVFDATEYYNTRSHILAGLALAWDWLYNDLDATERALLLSALVTLGTEHFAHSLTAWWGTVSTGSNFTGNNGAAVGLAGLATWGDLPQADLWFARGRQLVLSYFQEGFDDTGAGIEGVLYGNYGLRIPTYFSAAVERAGAPNPLHHAKIRRQPRWVAYEVLPGGGALNPLNDARYYDLNPTHMLWASSRGADPDLAGWIWENTAERFRTDGSVAEPVAAMLWFREPDQDFDPDDLLPLHQTFGGRGLQHVRSGWGPRDLMSSFESRHNDWGEGVHQNQDVNSFTLYAQGARFAIDSGYSNYIEKLVMGQDFEAARSSETEAHNAIEVDGRSQGFFGKGRLGLTISGDWIDIAHGDARQAYMSGQPEIADRWFVHVRSPDGGYILLADRFRKGGGTHDYRSYVNTEPGNTIEIGPQPPGTDGRATIAAPNGARLAVSVASEEAVTIAQDTFTADYPDVGYHPRLFTQAVGEEFAAITTLIPFAPGTPVEHAQPVPATAGTAVRTGSELALFPTAAGASTADGVGSDGVLTIVRDAGRFALVDGTHLVSDGEVLADITGGRASVVTGGAEVTIDGSQTIGFDVYAPDAVRVMLNGAPVPFTRCGTRVTSKAAC